MFEELYTISIVCLPFVLGVTTYTIISEKYNNEKEEKKIKKREKEIDDHIDYLIKNYPDTFDEIRDNYIQAVKLRLNKDQLIDLNKRIDDAHKDKLKIIADAFNIRKILDLNDADYIYVLNNLSPEKKELIEKKKIEEFNDNNLYKYNIGYQRGREDYNNNSYFSDICCHSLYSKKGYMDGYYGYNKVL